MKVLIDNNIVIDALRPNPEFETDVCAQKIGAEFLVIKNSLMPKRRFKLSRQVNYSKK